MINAARIKVQNPLFAETKTRTHEGNTGLGEWKRSKDEARIETKQTADPMWTDKVEKEKRG